jgi:serine/threonine-protein kinase
MKKRLRSWSCRTSIGPRALGGRCRIHPRRAGRGARFRVAGSAALRPGPARAARAARGTADLVAYDLFLKGRYYWSRRGADNLRTAIAYFEQAIARDPAFARAWAGLAMAQVALPYFTDLLADSLLAAASRNAGRALALDSTLADAHLARGYALKGEWRWSEADAEFRRALALAPDDATIRHWYGVMLYVTGRIGEGLGELSRAVELDPLSVSIATDHEYALYIARRYDEALGEGRRAAALEPTRSDIPFQDGMIQLARGRPDSAIVALERARRLGSGFDVRGYLSAAYRQLGSRRASDSIAAGVRAASRGDPTLGYSAAVAAASAGDRDAAVAELARATASHPLFLSEISLPCDPIFDPLRGDPRFGRLLHELGLAACTPEASR